MTGLTAGVTALAIIVVGCTQGLSDSSDAGSTPQSGESRSAAESGVGSASGRNGTDDVAAALQAERRQILTADVVLEVDDLREAATETRDLVAELGGFASGESIELGDSEGASATYRVPADRFRTVLDALEGVGELRELDIRGEDVTAQYADLEARVETMRTSISRLQGFLAEATDVGQVGLLEGELTMRESELESTEAQRRSLAEQVELSTISVTFTSENSVIEEESRLPSFLAALEVGWNAAGSATSLVLAATGFLLPFLPVAVVLWLLLRWRARRRTATP